MNKDNPSQVISEELQLLRKIDKKVDGIETQLVSVKKTAAVRGAVAGAISGGIVATGITLAKIKLGM